MNERIKTLCPMAAAFLLAGIDLKLPGAAAVYNSVTWFPTVAVMIAILSAVFVASFFSKNILRKMAYWAPLLTVLLLFLALWDYKTSKTAALSMPFFPAPGMILDVYYRDGKTLMLSIFYSMRLLVLGYLIGASLGLVTGTLAGWSPKCQYWLTPLQRFLGPVPATAWFPIAMSVFPTSFGASVAIIAISVWFPMMVMTSSGIANVPKSYYEVAQTLGGGRSYLIFKVAIPAALPNIFIGSFMGLGVSFVGLVSAEMLGVEAGLGWYIVWAQGWAEYRKIYAVIILMGLLFSSIIYFMFRLRDRFLEWQRGLIRW